MNEFEPHSFSNFFFSAVKEIMMMGLREVVWPRCRWEGGEGVGHISVKIKLTAFCLHLTLLHFKLMFMFILTFINFH